MVEQGTGRECLTRAAQKGAGILAFSPARGLNFSDVAGLHD